MSARRTSGRSRRSSPRPASTSASPRASTPGDRSRAATPTATARSTSAMCPRSRGCSRPEAPFSASRPSRRTTMATSTSPTRSASCSATCSEPSPIPTARSRRDRRARLRLGGFLRVTRRRYAGFNRARTRGREGNGDEMETVETVRTRGAPCAIQRTSIRADSIGLLVGSSALSMKIRCQSSSTTSAKSSLACPDPASRSRRLSMASGRK